jgi:hypothetical protein
MAVTRRFTRRPPTVGPALPPAPSRPPVPDADITYRGYRIQPGSYASPRSGWSPRAVVSAKGPGGWAQGSPLYGTNTAKFPTREEADRHALDVARAWIDDALARSPGSPTSSP